MAQEVIEITEREIEIIEVIERGPVGQTGPQPDINYEVVSSARTLEAADLIAADTSGGAFTLTLPANPSNGDAVDIFDFSETFDTNPLTIARNGQPIESLNEDLVANVEGAYFTLIYTGSTRGWQVLPRYGTSGGGGESALTTQGDMLYRGVGINTRLPIGSAGQILKVNSGATAPEWGAAPATGVTSVGVSGSDGIEVDSGSPITGSGTIALGVNAASLRSHINVADGANNYTHPNHSGEVTSSGDGATTIANDVVTNAKLANVATATIKGRATAGTGDPEDLTASQVRTILNVADGAEVNVQSNWTEADSGSDAFILNKPSFFTPSTHASTHHTGGTDAIAPNQISAAWAQVLSNQTITANTLLSAGRNRRITLFAFGATANVDLPYENNQAGDVVTLVSDFSVASTLTIRSASVMSGGTPLAYTTLATLNASGQSFTFVSNGTATGWSLRAVDTHTHPATQITGLATVATSGDYDDLTNKPTLGGAAALNVGTTTGTVCAGDDARLSDSRSPTAHAASHATGGSDPLAPSDIGLGSTDNVTFNKITAETWESPSANAKLLFDDTNVEVNGNLAVREMGAIYRALFDPTSISDNRDYTLPDATGTLALVGDAPASHTHGNITNAGLVGTTANLPLKTGTGGIVEAGAFGTGAGEFAEGNHTHTQLHDRSHAITSTSDHTAGNHKVFYSDGSGNVQELALGNSGEVLTSNGATSAPSFAAASGGGVTGAAASASDVLGVSGSDITGVDANADRIVFWDDSASALKYLEAGSGLSISGTTLSATASGGSKTYAVFTATNNQPPASNYATLDTRNSIAVLDYDDATDESAVFVSIIPEGASLGSGLKIRLHWMATTATSGDVVWDVSLERMNTDLDSDSFDTIASGTAAANGTSGILTVTEITLTTIDSVTAGDGFRLKVTRDANNASDTMSGDAELVVCEVRSAA